MQVDEVRMCGLRPNFVAALEHSDDDLQALFDRLSATSKIAAKLSAAQFRVNTSKKPAATPGVPAKAKVATNYTALFPPEIKARVDEYFAHDFEALGYAKDLSCI